VYLSTVCGTALRWAADNRWLEVAMSVEKPGVPEERKPTEKWRHLPERIKLDETTESVPAEPGHAYPTTTEDPNSVWTWR